MARLKIVKELIVIKYTLSLIMQANNMANAQRKIVFPQIPLTITPSCISL